MASCRRRWRAMTLEIAIVQVSPEACTIRVDSRAGRRTLNLPSNVPRNGAVESCEGKESEDDGEHAETCNDVRM
jgi:hypothetical protein